MAYRRNQYPNNYRKGRKLVSADEYDRTHPNGQTQPRSLISYNVIDRALGLDEEYNRRRKEEEEQRKKRQQELEKKRIKPQDWQRSYTVEPTQTRPGQQPSKKERVNSFLEEYKRKQEEKKWNIGRQTEEQRAQKLKDLRDRQISRDQWLDTYTVEPDKMRQGPQMTKRQRLEDYTRQARDRREVEYNRQAEAQRRELRNRQIRPEDWQNTYTVEPLRNRPGQRLNKRQQYDEYMNGIRAQQTGGSQAQGTRPEDRRDTWAVEPSLLPGRQTKKDRLAEYTNRLAARAAQPYAGNEQEDIRKEKIIGQGYDAYLRRQQQNEDAVNAMFDAWNYYKLGDQAYKDYRDENDGFQQLSIPEFMRWKNDVMYTARTKGYRDSGDPKLMTDEQLNPYLLKMQSEAEDRRAKAEKLKAAERPDSALAASGDVFDFMEGIRHPRQEATGLPPMMGGDAERKQQEAEAQIRADIDARKELYMTNAGEILDKHNPTFSMADDKDLQRKYVYEDLMQESYDEAVAGMSAEDRAELDARLDKVIEEATGTFSGYWSDPALENTEYEGYLREAEAFDAKAKEVEKEIQDRKILQELKDSYDEGWFTEERRGSKTRDSYGYDPSLLPEAPERLLDEVADDFVYEPKGKEVDKAYYWANNPFYGTRGQENSLDNVNKYMFLYYNKDMLDQFNTFYGYDRLNGSNFAEMFLRGIDNYLTTCLSEFQDRSIWNVAEDPVRGTAARLFSYVEKPVAGAMATIGAVLGGLGVEGLQDKTNKIFLPERQVTETRGRQNQLFDDWGVKTFGEWAEGKGQFLAGVVDSILDNFVARQAGRVAGAGDLDKTMKVIQLIMSGEATGSRFVENLDKDMDPTEAMLSAIGDGTIEWLTEKYSLEALLNPNVKDMLGDGKKLWKYFAKNFAAEGSEEIASDILNIGANELLSYAFGHESELKQKYNDLVRNGMGDREATRQVLTEALAQMGTSGLAGGLSGFISSIGHAGTTSFEAYQEGRNAKTNRNTQQLVDVGMGMKPGSMSREMAEKISDQMKNGKKPSNTQVGKLAQMMTTETGEQQSEVIRGTIMDNVKSELAQKGMKNPDAAAEVITRNLFEGGKMSRADMRVIAEDQRSIDVWKSYNSGLTEQRLNLEQKIAENTQEQKSLMDTIGEMTSEKPRRTGAMAGEIDRAVSETQTMEEAIDNLQARRSGLLSESFAQAAKEALANDEEARNNKRYLNDAMRIRNAVFTLEKAMPQTSLSEETARRLQEAAQQEWDEAEKNRVKNQVKVEPGKGVATFDGAEYGSDAWKEKLQGLTKQQRNQMDALAETVVRMGNRLNLINDTEHRGVYGFEQSDGTITINVAGMNRSGLQHHMLVTMSHELTHWLEQNSAEGYGALRQYVVDSLRSKGRNIEQMLVDTIDNQNAVLGAESGESLDMYGAMAELVAKSSENLLASEAFRNEIAQTDPGLFSNIRTFVKDFTARLRAAIEGMNSSLSREATALLDRTEEIAKLWLGARNEALGRAEGTGAAVTEGVSYSTEQLENQDEKGIKNGSLSSAAGRQVSASTSETTGEFTSNSIIAQEEDRVKRAREKELDEEYLQAIRDGDFKKQQQMIWEKINNTEGIYPFFAPERYIGEHRTTTKAIKDGDMKAIRKAAGAMTKYVPDNAVLIPMPGHSGIADENGGTTLLAKELSKITGAPVINALEGNSRESRYASKMHNKKGITAEEMGLRQVKELPSGYIPIIVDNVVSVGETAKAALDAIKGGAILSYTKGLAENVVPGLKAAFATKDKQNNDIPLSKKYDLENRNWRWSVEQSPDVDVDRFMMGMQEWNLNTAQEKTMLKQYKDLHQSIENTRFFISEQERELRKLNEKEQKDGQLSAFDRNERSKVKNRLENYRNRLDKLEAELARAASDEGYARLMMKQESLMTNLTKGVTADRMISLVEDMTRQLDEVNAQAQARAEKLQELAQKEAVLRVRQQFNSAGLKRIAAKLKGEMNSDLSNKDIENRLALIALKMKEGTYDQETTAELTDMILGQMRGGSDSYVLQELRGMSLTLSKAQQAELKAKDMSIRELNTELAGTGIRFTKKGNVNLDTKWDELCDRISSLNRDENELNQVDSLMNLIRSEKETLFTERFNDENIQGTTEAVLNAAAELIPEIVTDEKSLKLIRETLQYAQEVSAAARETAGEMQDVDAVIKRLKRTAAETSNNANRLTGGINEAIEYFNTLSEQSEAAMWKKERLALIDQLKSENTMNLLKEQEKWKQRIEKDKAAREQMENNMQLRRKISTNVGRIRKLLINETDLKNVPEHMKSLARAMLGKIVDNDLTGRKISGIDKQDLIETKRVLLAMSELDGDFTIDDLRVLNDEEAQAMVADALADLEDGIGFYNNRGSGDLLTNLQGMRNALERINDAVTTITNVINAERTVSFLTRRVDVADAAEDVKKDFGRSRFKGERAGTGRKARNAVNSTVFYGNMTPVYYFKMLRNGGMDAIWQDMQEGENRSGLEFAKTKDYIQKLAEKTRYRSWADEKHEVLLGGQKRTLTIENMMELYAIWQREKTTNPEMSQHLAKGGVYIQDSEDPNKGKPRRQTTEQRAVRVTDDEVQAIRDAMTDAQKEYMDNMVRYLSNEMSDLGNEASMRMYGIRKYKETYYFPMKVWDGVKSARSDRGIAGTDENRAAHRSWSKRRQHNAQNALVIGSFTQDAVNHIVEMINYNTMAPAIENVNKVLNYQFAEGETQDDITKRNLRVMFEETYGKEALRYLETFMKDLNGGVTQDQRKSLFDATLAMFKKNAVAGSLSVALQQPLSYIRAATMISPKYLAEALSPKYWKGSYAEMQKYSGVAVIKDMGRFDMNFGQSAKDFITPETKANAYEKISDALTAAPEMMDRMTWTRMWSAVKAETAAKNPGMDVTSDEFLQKVAQRFNDVMRQTQVYDSVLVKSSNMRSQKWQLKILTSFMAEPTLSLNLLADAVGSVRAGDKGAAAKAGKAGATFLLSAIMQAAVKGLMGSGRTPDEKKTWLENFLNKLQYNLQNEVNPLGLIPGYSDMIELMKNGELKDDAMGALGKVFQVWDTASKAVNGKGRGAYRDIEDTVGQLAQLFSNIPAKNLMRDARAIYNWITQEPYAKRANSGAVIKWQAVDNLFSGDNLLGALNAKLGEAGFMTTNKAYYDRMYEAMKSGNEQKVAEIREYLMMANGVSEKTINTGIRGLAKKDENLSAEDKADIVADAGTDKGAESYVIGLVKTGEMDPAKAREKLKEIWPDKDEDAIWWQVDRAAYKHETGKTLSSNEMYYRLKDAINANSAEAIREAISGLTEHGITKERVEGKLSDWKSDWLNADLDGKRKIRDAITKAYKALGYTKEDADKLIEKWSKEKKK